jgi:SAM-dependent methyltransferase
MGATSAGGDGYYLATGSAAEKRLALLDEVYGPGAARIIRSIDFPCSGRVVDLGCGTGNTVRWFAQEAGDAGEVTGVDFSAEQLSVARSRIESDGYSSIRLVEGSVYETGLPRNAFDIVHCRFVLCHLLRPMDGVREMAALARPGGLVIACDLDLDGIFSAPQTPAYERLRALIHGRAAAKGSDSRLGLKLPRMFAEAGLGKPEVEIVHPVYLRGERKRLWEHTLFEASAYMIEQGLCDQAELDRLAQELAAIAADESIAVAQAAMPVVWARKPS